MIEDDEKSRQLARLLRSKNPQDLELANRLIKNMVKQVSASSEKLKDLITLYLKWASFLKGRNKNGKNLNSNKRTGANEQ